MIFIERSKIRVKILSSPRWVCHFCTTVIEQPDLWYKSTLKLPSFTSLEYFLSKTEKVVVDPDTPITPTSIYEGKTESLKAAASVDLNNPMTSFRSIGLCILTKEYSHENRGYLR